MKLSRPTRGRKALFAVGAAAVAAAVLIPHGAFAALESLPGSNFEIDADANLKVDGVAPLIDWASVSEARKGDKPTGQSDDSFSGGTKEDDPCPKTTTGSIPNNKSDLLTFGAYQETQAAGPGFLHLFWTRVSEPSGTTVMDFELNKSTANCGPNGVNKVRSDGDLLIEYLLPDGGSTAQITVRQWSGSAWGTAQDLTALDPPLASGTINTSAIPSSESDGLAPAGTQLNARTFGEMTLDLSFVFDATSCESFGSAFLKSRSSTSFTSQLKDFIAPINVQISNCGKVVIRKETNPDENPNTTDFSFTKSFPTDPGTDNAFTLKDDGVKTFDDALVGPTDRTVVENVPDGWKIESVDCAVAGHPSSGVTPVINGATVTFKLDSASDVLDCTYTNRKISGAILVTKTRKHAASGPGDHPQAGVSFTVNGVTKATDANGKVCFDGLPLAGYAVHEITPAGYQAQDDKMVTVDTDASCTDNPYIGETVSFSNIPLTDITVSVTSQVPGGTASQISCTSLTATPADQTPDAFDDTAETFKNLVPGTYNCTVVVDP